MGRTRLVATFFADLHSAATSEAFREFFKAIEIENPKFPRTPISVLAIIEPDFSNRGFGHPDAVLRVESDEGTAVVILEAKRGPYVKACKPRSLRGVKDSGFNSSLNGQLELDYALALALQRFGTGDIELVEPEWISNTPYAVERAELKRKRRRLEKAIVLREVVTKFAGLPLQNYFFVALTTDTSNPFREESNVRLLPELYHPEVGIGDVWRQMDGQFGWVSYAAMESIIDSLVERSIIRASSLFLESLSLNRGNMDFVAGQRGGTSGAEGSQSSLAKRRGTSMVYAPGINAETFLHFSWRQESCALRDYSRSASAQPVPNRTYRTSRLRDLVEREILLGREEPVENTSYWHDRTLALNSQFLAGA